MGGGRHGLATAASARVVAVIVVDFCRLWCDLVRLQGRVKSRHTLLYMTCIFHAREWCGARG